MRLPALLIALLAGVTVGGAYFAFQLPEPMTETGKDVHLLYEAVLTVSFTVFFLVTSGIIYAAFRFRRQGDAMPAQIHGSSVLEALWTAIPILILVVLFVPSFLLVLDLKTPPSEDEADLVVEAVGHQWWWQFNYPDEKIQIQATPPNYENLDPPKLVIPVNQVILIKIKSTDVVHSFSAPNTLYKLQAIPGNVNEMHFTATKTGEYFGQCYQFCGLRHSDMRFDLVVLSQSDYAKWLRDEQARQGVTPKSDAAVAIPEKGE